MKRTEKDLHISSFHLNFAVKCKKNSSQMLQLSKIMLIFVPSFGKRRRHRGELLSFDPLENLQNSTYVIMGCCRPVWGYGGGCAFFMLIKLVLILQLKK